MRFHCRQSMGGCYSTVDDIARFADALVGKPDSQPGDNGPRPDRHIEAEYGGRDGYGFETRSSTE